MLVKFVSNKREDWSSYLDTCVFAYNTSRHSSTKFTPFELMFNRRACLPIDVEVSSTSPDQAAHEYQQQMPNPDVAIVHEHHQQLLSQAKTNIIAAQKKQKELYDKKHAKPERYKVGQLVLKLNHLRKKTKGGKLKKRYTGPYNIISAKPRGAYEISDGTKTIQVSGPHLKPYNDPPICDSGSIVDYVHLESPHKDSAHLESPHKDSLESPHEYSAQTTSVHLEFPHEDSAHLESPHEDSLESSYEDSAHTTSAHLESPHKDSAHIDFVPHHVSPEVDFAQREVTRVDSHHNSIPCQNQSTKQGRLSPIAQNSSLFQPDEPSLSFIDQEESLLPAPMLSLSQMISNKPQPQFCSTPKRPRSPTVQREVKKKRILSLTTHQKRSGLTPSLASLKSNKTSRLAPSFKPTHQNATQKRMFNLRQAKIPRAAIEQSRKEIIDVDTCTPKSTEIQYWIPELHLTVNDREVLLNPLGWLTDNLINAAQELIKRASPAVPGLQDVIKGAILSYDVESAEFVQILHNHHGHWLTVSTIGTVHPVVNVYDSMYRSVSTGVKAQIATLLHTKAKEITLNFMNVHIQAGGCDCGLFAIANATALAFGHSPGLFQYNQPQMRQHLLSCFQNQAITIFPMKKYRRAPRSIVSTDTYSVYCICRMPEMSTSENRMVECSTCGEWYHYDTCIKVPAAALSKSAVWHCSYAVSTCID